MATEPKAPAAAYRRFVQQGVNSPLESPFTKAAYGWLLGSQAFVDRIRASLKPPRFQDEVPRARTLESVDYEAVFEAVCASCKVDRAILSERGDGHVARAAAAWLSRRLTTATLRELATPLGLGRPESVSNLTRRMERQLTKDPTTKEELAKIEARLAKETKNKV